ncbi:MAG: hypothetical protein HYT80_02500 [Euryarchaeota archaeon]|nr:hypothetical protein [Euryarchaeota archaeon]
MAWKLVGMIIVGTALAVIAGPAEAQEIELQSIEAVQDFSPCMDVFSDPGTAPDWCTVVYRREATHFRGSWGWTSKDIDNGGWDIRYRTEGDNPAGCADGWIAHVSAMKQANDASSGGFFEGCTKIRLYTMAGYAGDIEECYTACNFAYNDDHESLKVYG